VVRTHSDANLQHVFAVPLGEAREPMDVGLKRVSGTGVSLELLVVGVTGSIDLAARRLLPEVENLAPRIVCGIALRR
jgi:hypothetical protein